MQARGRKPVNRIERAIREEGAVERAVMREDEAREDPAVHEGPEDHRARLRRLREELDREEVNCKGAAPHPKEPWK